MDICPICSTECTNEQYHESVGLVEEHIKCPNHCWNYSYTYGNTEILIGDFITGYNHTTSKEDRIRISDAIRVLIDYYKEQYKKDNQ